MKFTLCLIVLLTVLFSPLPVLADEDWTIESFNTTISISSTGTVVIKESINVDFSTQEKHGIYRDIPYAYTKNEPFYYTEVILSQVRQDGQKVPVDTSKNNNNIRFKIGDPNKTISGKHTYQISYQVRGVLLPYQNYDEFYWNVTGNEWGVPIQKATADVFIEAPILKIACYQGVLGSSDQNCTSFQADQKNAHFASSQVLPSKEGLTIVVGFQKGIIPIVTIARPRSLIEQLFSPASLLLFGLSLFASIVFALWMWWKWGRDFWWKGIPGLSRNTLTTEQKPFGAHQQIVVEYEPPENLRPAEIGVLVDEKADTLDVVATIIDLAVRGYLAITEEPKKWIFGSVDYTLIKANKSTETLLSYEKELLNRLFDNGDTVTVSELKTTFYQDLSKVKEKLYEQVTLKRLFPDNPDKVRTKYLLLGIAICILGAFFIIQGGSGEAFYLISIGIGILLGGLSLILLSRSMPRRTAQGNELYRRTKGYQLFISKAEGYKQQFFERKNMFNEVLPYAIVFGLTEKYAQAMKDMGVKTGAIGWYYGSATFNPVVFSSHINSFSNSLSSAIASAPKSSGFSGGGSSGGGFGGGGGGSW